MSSARVTGKVKFFNEDKGWGFIQPDDMSAEVFVHCTDLGRSCAGLLAEQRVSYELVDNPRKDKGKKAANVELA